VLEWVEVMDTDQSGNIEKEEFYNFFSDFDELALTDGQVEAMFSEFDISGDGSISCDEFARAIQQSFEKYLEQQAADKEDEDDVDLDAEDKK
jgi:Ca2+-binding EF-hand superfamily protein